MSAVVIGIGNSYRRDDGVGPMVAADIAGRHLPGVRVMTEINDPAEILDVWDGAALAVVIDAAVGLTATPGWVRRWHPGDRPPPASVSSHALGLAQTYALGRALSRTPGELVVFTVDVSDTGHGVGLSPPVAAAVPELSDAVLGVLDHRKRKG